MKKNLTGNPFRLIICKKSMMAQIFVILLFLGCIVKGVDYYEKRGLDFANKGQYDNAITEFTKAIEIDPNDYGSYVNRANQYGQKGECKSAISDISKAIEIKPDCGPCYHFRGTCYVIQAEYDKAITDFNKTLEFQDNLTEFFICMVLVDRGEVLEKRDQYDDAISDYNRAISIYPKCAKAYEKRGILYWNIFNNQKEACLDLKRACELGKCKSYNYIKERGFCK